MNLTIIASKALRQRMYPSKVSVCACFAYVCVLFSGQVVAATSIGELEQQTLDQQASSAKVQRQIDQLYDEEKSIDREYRLLLTQLANIQDTNLALQKRGDRQAEQLASLREQLISIEQISREIIPLMGQMQQSLQGFIDADLPFKQRARIQEAEQLAADLTDVDLALSVKYQKLLSAFEKEAAYGLAMETFQGQLEIAGVATQVDFLQLGRVALYYQTLDAKQAGLWISDAQRWQLLNTQQAEQVGEAIRIANGLSVPKLTELTVDRTSAIVKPAIKLTQQGLN